MKNRANAIGVPVLGRQARLQGMWRSFNPPGSSPGSCVGRRPPNRQQELHSEDSVWASIAQEPIKVLLGFVHLQSVAVSSCEELCEARIPLPGWSRVMPYSAVRNFGETQDPRGDLR
ncbi:hypothetical protein NDU88_002578 [Pleurodeles waltl]|uniref:Uncharacterized protein n=1 Tax=Pleurodeles waltl TaxID=8319 RepID=A0AAV7TL32_PLEWA|nr:hypothetical protein NDU88_002578 [Pleurodeles waltl]